MSWHEFQYDRHAFEHRAHVVSASSGISFEDARRMHVDQRVVQRDRRLPTPPFAMRDADLKEAVLTYCERRLYLPHDGTVDERRARIDAKASSIAEDKREQLANMVRAYALTKSDEHRAAWETQIVNWDSDLVMGTRGYVAVVLSVAYLYWRTHWDGPDIAAHLGLRNPHVRQLLARIALTWKRREAGALRAYSGSTPRRAGQGARKLLRRARISRAMAGRTFSDESRARMSAAARRRAQDPVYAAAHAERIRAAWARGVFANRRARRVTSEQTQGDSR